MILLLLIVGFLYSIFGKLSDALTIFVIIITLVLVEIFNEYKAKKTIEALKKFAAPLSLVVREGDLKEIPTTELVPGDILLLKVGQKIPADARLLESYGLQVNESALTGESTIIAKDAELILSEKTELMERKNMIFAGTTITRGKGKAMVVYTSMDTEIGHIAGLIKAIKEPKTPLQLAMKQLTGWLVIVALFFSILIPVIGILQGRPWIEMILTGLSLSFAVIPEELPIIITMVLALGAFVLSRKHALVKYLKAAETLGSVTVVATDKTGTLTENKMKLSSMFVDRKTRDFDAKNLTTSEKRLLSMSAIINDILVKEGGSSPVYIGDPMELALINAAEESGISYENLKKESELKDEISFDNNRMMMSQIYAKGDKLNIYVKGATEAILDRSTMILQDNKERQINSEDKKIIIESAKKMAENGLRVISFAYKMLLQGKYSQDNVENELIFAGMVGFIDPPRSEAKEAIHACKKAGVRVIMITGDYDVTAKSVAQLVDIESDKILLGKDIDEMTDQELKEKVKNVSIFARTTPEHKFRLVKTLKEIGEIVAVTGDGINDAPALKLADIGVAMGETGTDIAREAADMILLDDNFASITESIKQGRKLFDNLKKGVRYYLACKCALISIFLLPIFLNVPLPFAPIQIILLELFMDLAASATFVAEPAESNVMTRKPRNPKEKFMNLKMIRGIFFGAISLFFAVIFVYLTAYYQGKIQALTMAFATWMVGHIFLAINMRSEKDPLSKLGPFSNKMTIAWAISVLSVLFVVVSVPLLQINLKLMRLMAWDWLVIFSVSFVSTFWMEAVKIVLGLKDRK